MPECVIHIVEDDESVRNSLAFLLTSSGLAVRVHVSASEFLAVAPDLRHACLVSDLRMPDISGVDLLKRLRAAGIDIPTVIVTARSDVKGAVEAMKNGAIDFIEKPYSSEELLRAVMVAIRIHEGRAQAVAEQEAVRGRIETLTQREQEVLAGLLSGHSSKAIAQQLDLSPRTVELYRGNLMAKMRAGSLAELVRMVMSVPDRR